MPITINGPKPLCPWCGKRRSTQIVKVRGMSHWACDTCAKKRTGT